MTMRTIALALLLSPVMALAATAATTAADRPEAAADPLDRTICKRFTQIGSLIATNKVCKTKRDWDKERSNLRMRDPIGTCAGGGGDGIGAFCGSGGQ